MKGMDSENRLYLVLCFRTYLLDECGLRELCVIIHKAALEDEFSVVWKKMFILSSHLFPVSMLRPDIKLRYMVLFGVLTGFLFACSGAHLVTDSLW